MSNGKTYVFQVRAITSAGTIRSNAITIALTLRSIYLQATGGDRQITVNWGYSNPPAGANRWQYRAFEDGTAGNWHDFSPTGDATLRSATITQADIKGVGFVKLSNGIRYAIAIRLINSGGDTLVESVVNNQGWVTATPSPIKLIAAGDNNKVHLAWTYSGTTQGATGWQWQAVGGGWDSGWRSFTTVDTAQRYGSISPLTNNTQYSFRVRLVDGSGNLFARTTTNNTGWVNATPTSSPNIPVQPTGLKATPGNQQVTLSWNNPDDASIRRYSYQLRQGAGSWGTTTTIPDSGPTTTSYTITGLTNGSSYSFQITASNSAGSNGSNVVTVTLRPYTITLSAPDLTNNQVTEGDSGLKQVSITATLSDPAPSETSIDGFTLASPTTATLLIAAGCTNPGSAAADYCYPQGSVVLLSVPEGETQATGRIGIIGDTRDEEDETIVLTMSNLPTGWSSSGDLTITILDDDDAGGPAKPTGFTVSSAGSTQLILSWTNPNDPSITKWQYQQKAGVSGTYGSWINIPNSGPATTRYAVSGLSNTGIGTDFYFFKIRAVNGIGNGTPSDQAGLALTTSNSTLTATAGNGEVALAWTLTSGRQVGSGRVWAYRQAEGMGSYGAWQKISASNASTRGYTVTGLNNGTSYAFQVGVTDPSGPINADTTSNEATATPTGSTPTPAAPTGLSAEAGNAQVVLTWTDPEDDSITGYQVQQRKGSADWGGWTAMSGSAASTTRHTVTGLDNDSQYSFRIRSQNGGGNSPQSAVVRATPAAPAPVPAKPSGFGATKGDRWVYLTWSNPSDASITRWEYRQKSGNGNYGSWERMTSSGAATVKHQITGLTNGTAYRFRIRAVNGNGNGAASDEVTSTPNPAPAPVLTGATSTTNRNLTLTWTHAGTTPGDYVNGANSNAGVFWQTGHRLKGTTTWTAYGGNVSSANGNSRRTSSALISSTAYPNGASVEVAIRASADATTLLGRTDVKGPWSNPRTVTFMNTNMAALTITGAPVTVAPGATATYTVALTKAYGGTLSITSANPDKATVSPGTLNFTTSNYNTGQTVRVTGVVNGTATINHAFRLPGANADAIPAAGTVAVTVANAAGVTISTAALTVAEGGSKPYTMRLNTAPSNDVAVTVAGAAGDVTVQGSPLNFTTSNWNMPQTITVNAGTDTDTTTDDDVTLTHSASGGGYGSVSIASVVVSVAESGVAPAKPTGLAAAAGDGEVTLSWTDMDNPTISKWQYRQKAGSSDWGDWRDIGGSGAATTSHTVSGLTNDTAYQFEVRAVNGAGNGAGPDAPASATPMAPGVTITPTSLPVNEGGSGEYTVKLDTAASANVTITVGGASGEVTVTGSPLTFTPTNYSTVQRVTVNADIDEDTEDGTVTLTHASSSSDTGYGALLTIDAVTVTVTDTTPTLQLLTDPATVSEGENIVLTVTSDKAVTGDLPVRLTLADRGSSGFTAADIAGNLGPRDFPASFGSTGSTTGTVSIATSTDNTAESAETYRITLNDGTGYAPGADKEAVGRLNNVNNVQPGVTIQPTQLSLAEGGRAGSYTVVLNTDPSAPVTVTPSPTGPDAAAVMVSAALSFTPSNWDTAQTVTVTPVDDLDAADATVTVTNAVNGSGAYASVTAESVRVSVEDDETPSAGVTIQPTQLSLAEGGRAGSYTVVLNTDPSAPVTVTPSPTGPDAAAVMVSAALSFTPSNWDTAQTVTVTPLQDEDATDENITVSHDISGYSGVSNVDGVTVTVTDTTPTLQLLDDPTGVSEGTAISLTVTSDKARTGDLPVMLTLAARSASGFDADDIEGPLGPRSFTASFGESASTSGTVSIPTSADAVVEGGEAYRITLSDGSGYAVGDDTTADGTINDATPPAQPAGFTATAGDGMVTLGWQDPDNDSITVYQLRQKRGSAAWGGWGEISGSGATTTRHIVTNLDNEVEYSFRIRARNSGGESDESAVATATPTDAISTGPVLQLLNNPAAVREGEAIRLTVTADREQTGRLPLSLTLSARSSSFNANDISGALGPRTFNADFGGSGRTTGTVTISTRRDSLVEGAEAYRITLNPAAGYTVGDASTADGRLNDGTIPSVTVFPTALTVVEGGSTTYTVRLNNQPSADVTITVGGASGDVSVTDSSLIFTPANYRRAQTVTVNAASDEDTADDRATLTHSANGGGYNSARINNVRVSVTDTTERTPVFQLRTDPAPVREGEAIRLIITANRTVIGNRSVSLTLSPRSGSSFNADDIEGTLGPGNFTASFAASPGSTSGTVIIPSRSDALVEGDEAYRITLNSGSGYELGTDTTADGTINDGTIPGVTVSPTALTMAEGGSGTYTVRLDNQPSGNVTITVGGASGDVTVAGSPLIFTSANYSRAQTVTVNAAADEDTANDRATLTHSANGGGYHSVSIDSVSVTVTDTTPVFQLRNDPAPVREGEAIRLTITANRTVVGNRSVSLTLSPRSGSSFDANDIEGMPGPGNFTVSFAASPGSTSGTVIIPTRSDAVVEGAEHYRITLNDGSGYALGTDTTADGTINDGTTGSVTVSPTALTVAEGGSTTYTVRLDNQPSAEVTITVGGASGDVTVADSSLTFTPANYSRVQTVTVNAAADEDATDDSATLIHSASGGGYNSVSIDPVIVTVDDDDTAGVTVSPTTLPMHEGRSGQYTVKLDTEPSGTVTITPTTGDSRAVMVSAALTFTTANWKTPQTVMVSTSQDADAKDETVTVRHAVTGYGAVTTAAPVTVEVTDDETEHLGQPEARKEELVGLSRATLGMATDMIGARIAGDLPGNGAGAGSIGDQAWAMMGNLLGFSHGSELSTNLSLEQLEEQLWRQSFHISQTDRETDQQGWHAAGEQQGSWSLWGAGELRSFKGDDASDAENHSYSGSIKAGWLGIDYQFTNAWLAGLAVSFSSSESHYTYRSEGGMGAGETETQLTTFLPYGSLQLTERLQLWGTAGIGFGDLRHQSSDDDDDSEAQGALKVHLAAIGFEQKLSSLSSWNAFSLAGDLAVVQSSTEWQDNALNDQSVSITRARLGVNSSFPLSQTTTGYMTLRGRLDGGDLQMGAAEMLLGLRYSTGRFSALLQGRQTSALDGSYSESGILGQLRFSSQQDGTGLAFQLQPSFGPYGEVGSEQASLWNDQQLDALTGWNGNGQQGAAMALKSTIGYGFLLPDSNLLLTPFAEAAFTQATSHQIGLGISMEGPSWQVKLSGSREESSNSTPTGTLKLMFSKQL